MNRKSGEIKFNFSRVSVVFLMLRVGASCWDRHELTGSAVSKPKNESAMDNSWQLLNSSFLSKFHISREFTDNSKIGVAFFDLFDDETGLNEE